MTLPSGGRIGGTSFPSPSSGGGKGGLPGIVAPLVIEGAKYGYSKYKENENRKKEEEEKRRKEAEKRDSRLKHSAKFEYTFQPFKRNNNNNNGNNNNMNRGNNDKGSKFGNIGGKGGKGGRGGSGNYNRSSAFNDNRGTNIQALSQRPITNDQASGIKSGTLVAEIQRSRGSYKSLGLLTGWLTPAANYTPNSNLDNFIKDIVYPTWLNSVKTHLNFETTITIDEFKGAVSGLITALSTFYCVDSVNQYMESDNNVNIGMNLIRNKFDSNILRLNRNLGDTIARYVIPPEIIKLVMWLNGNYTTGVNPTSCMIKTSFGQSLVVGSPGFIKSSDIQAQIDNLNSENILNTLSKMERAMPSWRMSELPKIDGTPKYDENFINFWMNQPIITRVSNGDLLYFPNKELFPQESKTYGIINNNHDGLVYALSTTFSDKTGNPQPGLWYNHIDTSLTNDWQSNKFYSADDNQNFKRAYSIKNYDKYFCCVHNVGPYANNTYIYGSEIPFGCQQIQEHSAENTLSALYKSVEMLYDTRSIR